MNLKDLINTGIFGTDAIVCVKTKNFIEDNVEYSILEEGNIMDEKVLQYQERYIEHFSWGDNNILIINIC